MIDQHRVALRKKDAAAWKLRSIQMRIEKKEKQKDSPNSLTNEWPPLRLADGTAIYSRGAIRQEVQQALSLAIRKLGPRASIKIVAVRKEAEAELLRRYNRHIRKHRAKRKAAGITAADKAKIDAMKYEQESLRRLMLMKPKTPVGLAALLDYFGELTEAAHVWRRLLLARQANARPRGSHTPPMTNAAPPAHISGAE